MNCITSVDRNTLAIDLIGQLSRDVIGHVSVKPLMLSAMKTLNVIDAFRSGFCQDLSGYSERTMSKRSTYQK